MWEVLSLAPENENATREPSAEKDGCLSVPSKLASGDIWSSASTCLEDRLDHRAHPRAMTMTAANPRPIARYGRCTAGGRNAAGAWPAAKASATSAADGRALGSFASILVINESIGGGTAGFNCVSGVGSNHAIACAVSSGESA